MKALLFILSSFFFLVSPNLASMDLKYEVRKITPPNLEEASLGKKILCHRPMREGMPNMSVEVVGEKIVANNYGHGGSGWTLGPGTAQHVLRLLEKSDHAKELDKNSPITVIGAGAIGLYTAYGLHINGYKNIIIVAENFENLTSHNAG